MDLQVNVIEDKRKFDIMEFVSFGSQKDARGGERRGGISFLSSALPTLSLRCYVW